MDIDTERLILPPVIGAVMATLVNTPFVMGAGIKQYGRPGLISPRSLPAALAAATFFRGRSGNGMSGRQVGTYHGGSGKRTYRRGGPSGIRLSQTLYPKVIARQVNHRHGTGPFKSPYISYQLADGRGFRQCGIAVSFDCFGGGYRVYRPIFLKR